MVLICRLLPIYFFIFLNFALCVSTYANDKFPEESTTQSTKFPGPNGEIEKISFTISSCEKCSAEQQKQWAKKTIDRAENLTNAYVVTAPGEDRKEAKTMAQKLFSKKKNVRIEHVEHAYSKEVLKKSKPTYKMCFISMMISGVITTVGLLNTGVPLSQALITSIPPMVLTMIFYRNLPYLDLWKTHHGMRFSQLTNPTGPYSQYIEPLIKHLIIATFYVAVYKFTLHGLGYQAGNFTSAPDLLLFSYRILEGTIIAELARFFPVLYVSKYNLNKMKGHKQSFRKLSNGNLARMTAVNAFFDVLRLLQVEQVSYVKEIVIGLGVSGLILYELTEKESAFNKLKMAVKSLKTFNKNHSIDTTPLSYVNQFSCQAVFTH